MKHMILILMILCAALPLMAEMPGAVFVNTEMGGRSIGMGRSYAAIAEGGEYFIYNVAGSAFFDKKEVFFNFQGNDEFDQNNNALSFSMPVAPLYGTIGLNMLYFGLGTVDATGSSGEILPSFEVYQMVIGLTYATKINEHVGVGIALKYINDHLDSDFAGDAFAIDFGGLYKNEKEINPDLTLVYSAGATLQNIGTRISYQDREQADALPRYLRSAVRGSLDYQPWNTMVTMSLGYDMDFVENFTDNASVHWGCEVAFMDVIFLRGGYYSNNYYEDSAFNWGLGFSYANISLDFAMDNLYSLEKGSSIYSLSFRF